MTVTIGGLVVETIHAALEILCLMQGIGTNIFSESYEMHKLLSHCFDTVTGSVTQMIQLLLVITCP